jgi:SAM-dependent methyltransferase
MSDASIRPPSDFDWRSWIDRWNRMQERYLAGRAERFSVILRMIRATQPAVRRVVELGCGPGSLMLRMLECFPQAEVIGIDFDPAMLLLGKLHLAEFGERVRWVSANLREPGWAQGIPIPADAVVSATALHWLDVAQLAAVYHSVAEILGPGGIFLNADHVGSDSPKIQDAWEENRKQRLARAGGPPADDWNGFWDAFGKALGVDADELHRSLSGGWEGGIENGLPLAWHLDALRAAGFSSVDCFWRRDCDAIYGGMHIGGKFKQAFG